MPSLSINNDHGKTFTGSLATMETVGNPLFSVSSSNGIFSASPSLLVNLSDTSLLSSQAPGTNSGIILSGMFINRTQNTKESFSYNLPLLAVLGNQIFIVGSSTLSSMGVTNPSSGDQVTVRFNYTLPGAVTTSVVSMDISLT